MNSARRQVLQWTAAGAAMAASARLPAQPGPLRAYVGFPPGGAVDQTARTIAEKARGTLGAVLVENRPGAAGNIAASALAQARPDGTTLMFAPVNVYCIAQSLYRNPGFHPVRDFAPVGTVAAFPWGLAVASSVPADTLQELVAWLKDNPKQSSCGMAAIGSEGHLLAYQFSRAAGIDLSFIGYKGGAPMAQDLMGGQIPMAFDPIVNQLAPHNAGKFKVLAVTSAQRAALLPRVPTFEELGYDTVIGETWIGVAVPRGTPTEKIQQINTAFTEAVQADDVVARLAQAGLTSRPSTPAMMEQLITADIERYGALIKASGLKLE